MPLADVEFELVRDVVVAHVEGEIDMSNGDELRAAVGSRVPADTLGLVLDLREVGYLDSAGVHLVFGLHERLGDRGQQLGLVVEPGSSVADVMRISEVVQTVPAFETVGAALQSIEQ